MPAKIVLDDNSADPMVISLDAYNAARTHFKQHYYLAGCNNVFGGQDLQIPWAALNTAVNNYKIATTTENVALRFVYCFDTIANALFLRLQLCTMQQSAMAANEFMLDTTVSNWHRIKAGQLNVTPVHTLSDANYLTSFYYSPNQVCAINEAQQLATDTSETLFVRNITYPWAQEILAMYLQNGSPTNASVCFGACSFATAGLQPVMFPHGMVIYLKNSNGEPLLNNENYIVVFENKGCDIGTVCPPNCNVYILPS